ncbi:microtubule-associated protein futsch-like isoform x2 protein [Lasius niger]|uniref:Microtubule-associated protein futsch-like isoform x2 protein n=1 Tax=Lasius niger TaxID=67767 RepID=A0A0J7L6T8_LASNI|nr:microtubule-associated protein futsch-like isoform x2 protein [Lasius niger]
MPRSMRDSDDDAEPKTGRVRSQKLTVNSAVNSPLRRSSRIKQGRSSPISSESDTSSISSNQPIKNTRGRRATMDNVSDKLKGGHSRKPSISPDIESIEVDILGTPKKRATRSSLAAVTSIDTPTKINTRAASKRLMRAGSETKSPLPTVRTTRRTRATSVEPESLFEQNRSQPGTPVKIHKRASVLLSDSPVKKEDEKKNRIPYVRLDATIVETDEFTNSGNSDSSPDKALRSQQSQRINKRHQSIYKDKDEVEEDNNDDELLQLSEKRDELHDKHTDKITVDNEINLVEECKSEENLLSNNDTTDEVSIEDNFSRNLSSSKKEDKLEIINKSPSGVKKSLDIGKHSKELMIKIENLTNTSVKEQKGNPSNKENQILNIINDTLIENIQPITNVTSSSKCLTPIHLFANKSSSEKETKFTKNESTLIKRRHSRESIETTMKHGILSKEVIDDIEEKMDISTDSSSPDLTYKQKYLDSPSVNDTTKRQSLVHEADSKSTKNDTNESVLSQHEDVETVDEATVKDKTPIKQISKPIEMEEVTKSDKVDKMERAITDTDADISKDSNEIELNEILCLPKNQSETERESDNKKSSSPISIIDDNEMRLVLEEQSLCRNENESSNKLPHFNSDHSVDLPTVVVSSVNKNSNNQSSIMENQSVITQDNITDSTDFTEQEQQNFSKQATESVLESSNTALETLDSTSNESNKDNSVIQNTQLSNVTEASGYVTSISSKREERKRMWLKNSVKQNLKRKSTDNIHDHLEKEKENLQLENQKDTNTNTDPDVSVNISLFQDISSDNSNKKIIEKEIDVETISVHSNSQLLKESENESECDLVLVDKKAWLAAENMKATKEAESFEYDSDDTVLLKSRQDAMTTNYDVKLPTINEELLESRVDATVGSRDKKSLTMMEKEKLERQEYVLLDSSLSSTEDDDDLIAAVNKSINEFKIILNQSNDRSISKLNKSGQTVAKAMERSFKTHDKSDEQIEDDANGLNRSSQVNKEDTSLLKSIELLSKAMERRRSLNKSSTKDTPSRKGDKAIQNISISKSREDYSMKEPDDDTDADLEKKLQKKKHSLNKSQNKDENTSESEEKSLSKPVNPKIPTHLNDDESDNSEIVIRAVNFECENYSTGSDSDKVSDSNDTDVSTSVHSDVKREYNLDGAEQKFSDDNVPGDECRASESEVSDPDDDGSDLADFIVDDDEVEKEEDDNDDEEKEESNSEEENDQNIEEAGDAEEEEVDDESENEQNVKEDKVAGKKEIKDKNYEQVHIDVQNVEDENEEDDILDEEEDEEKHIPPPFNTRMSSLPEIKSTKIKRDSKVRKSDVMKNKTILLDTSDSDSSIKNKSYTKKNEDTILLDMSSNLSAKKKRKSEVQFSPKDVAKQNLIEYLNTLEIRKLPQSLLKCSTPKFDTHKQKFEFNETSETLEKISEIKDTKSGSTKTTQNISLEKKKSNKDSILKEHCLEFKNTRERLLNISLPSNLTEAIEKAGLSKPSSKMAKLHKTMNVTHTESPTIRYLRKEKLNESAPALRVNIEIDSLEKKLLPIKKTKDIVQTETKLESNEEEISNLVTPPNDDAIQKSNRKKQKKRKTPAEDISSENITDKASFQDMESDAPKKKKRVKLVQLPIVEDDTCKDTCQIDEKKKKRKKKQLKINEQNENVNEANVLQKNIRKNKTELAQHKRTNLEIVDSSELDLSADNYMAVEKKTKRQKIAESKEIVSEKLLKKKKKREERTSPTLQTGISKLKSNKNLKSNKLQNIASDTIKSKNDTFARARDEALEAIRAAEMRIRAKKELKKKKQENVENMIREQVLKIPDKKQDSKKVVEKNDFLPSTGRLKRLPDDVIENLTDLPTKARKRQKLSRHQEQIVPLSGHSSKSKASTAKDGFVALSSSGSTTEFAVVDLQEAKKPQQTSFAAASFRQRMLARNTRAPVSAYMMYLEKQKATSNSRFFNNAF